MKISVALCTYNGERFLKAQLDSIFDQTLPVNEIIICDDGSTDQTEAILREYQKKHPETVKIYINGKNLKSVKNFEKAISLCTGEIIFLCDQDDIWEKEKTKKFIKYFNEFPLIKAICSNGIIIDNDGNPVDQLTIWSIPKLLQEAGITVDYFNIIAFIENIATGAGMAFRSSLRKDILPIPEKSGFHHDEWIALVSSHENGFMFIEDQLLRYRVHDNQQVGGIGYKNTDSTRKKLIRHFDLFSGQKTFSQYKKFLKRLSESYQKHLELISRPENIHTDISEEIIQQCKELFHFHRKKMKNKFPVRFFILTLADYFSKKRKIP